jgi:hypothetical protein
MTPVLQMRKLSPEEPRGSARIGKANLRFADLLSHTVTGAFINPV